ncbi:pyruvate kinase [Virgibacillus pantothenticus]|uniref:Pyruvate kinase n=2 Tax=Bacillati TaxID=1783272 RepID=A0A0L0QRD7_VIRPA|nr:MULTISPECIES: pyruvate kinase [Virgibacillus]API90826.1 pyruvate kinase [Virgibacillus sp. 6R]KNE20773.1 pyruvate kinase [Virgibacillus pantothenticus]MBS7426741.1 pyruvate kinase [Virgibacillus sp. 19R1-5]MBU8566068.1 pyruvate kinase [Virgibacillus pantothenticus]MBU8602759.1 pyruvate kinase [Virgibacillus pantothenticus]
MRNTKIVCTIGPASESIEKLEKLIESGMNVARLNFSHGNYEEHAQRIQNIRSAAEKTGKTVAILLDTKGPEIRTHDFVDGQAELVQGEVVYVSMKEVEGTSERFSVTYSGLIDDVHEGSKILLDDGLIELEVVEVNKANQELKTVALNSGLIKNKKGVNVPNVSVNLPGITEKDANDIIFGIEHDIDFIAASFVRRASDVLEIKELLEQHNATHIQIIPKIENQEGVDNIDSILEVSDGLMVARGDLGVEIPAEDVPLVQKKMIKQCNTVGKPVITATQMLDSMQRNPRPTRAEASDVANAIFDGTDAIMLSGETAAGNYPVEAVQTMSNIALKAETALDHQSILKDRSRNVDMTITDAISQSVTHTAMNLSVSAIITPTESGHTARMISKYRPHSPILAVTFSERVNRRLSLVWGVHAVMCKRANSTDEMLDIAVERGLRSGMVEHGNRVIITAGVPVGQSGTTNLLKVHVIGNVIAKGQGIGRKSAFGKAVVVKSAEEAVNRVNEGDIVVTYGSDREMMPAIEKAAGIVTEEGGLTSHAAVVGLSLGIPVIVGVKDVFDAVTDGEVITIDGANGDIYQGHTRVL